MMIKILSFGLILGGFVTSWAQDPKQALAQRVAEIKQAAASNQSQLKQYQWTETTELSLKGEVKKRDQKDCRYGPDGKVVKTTVGDAAPPPKQKKGVKGKIVAKKVDELQDYMERVGGLVSRYVPPDPTNIQASFQANKASVGRSADGGMASVVFNDYVKPGDQVTIAFNTATKKVVSFDVSTYLDGQDDSVRLNARFSTLADGTSYPEETILNATKKQIQVKTTNFGHRKSN